ncbi:hypothetical protein M472_08115 [Sphingobacterium paucimobilis HER1398]|uniref:Uncharacterized protein n=2 Tax=Sphingobacterium TaxID=28453 RepID=U2HAG4_9SPHI|nr:hypothetical protein M472_08115 [Sphingobacterium paucimobilis HER1398]
MVLSGCSALQQPTQEGGQMIPRLQTFDGVYRNTPVNNPDMELLSLWNQLSLNDKIDTLDFKNAEIVLETKGDRQIKAIWLQGGVEKKSILVHGKLKDNYFVSRHSRTIIPIPLVYGHIANNQFQLWLDNDGQLHVDRLQNRWGWVFVFLAGVDNTSSYVYPKSR